MAVEIIKGNCSHSQNVQLEFGVEAHMRVQWCPHCGALTVASPHVATKIAERLKLVGVVIETDLAGSMRFHTLGGDLAKLVPNMRTRGQ